MPRTSQKTIQPHYVMSRTDVANMQEIREEIHAEVRQSIEDKFIGEIQPDEDKEAKKKEYADRIESEFQKLSEEQTASGTSVLEEQVWFEWTRHKCLTDTYFLGMEVLGLKKAQDKQNFLKWGGWQYRIDPSVHKKMCSQLDRDEDTLLLYARGMMKTTWMKIFVVRWLLNHPYGRVGYFTRTRDLVGKEMDSLKAYLENPYLIELFPDMLCKRGKWKKDTRHALTIQRPEDYTMQENQVEGWSVGSSIAGHHYDLHIYDDIINDKDKSSTQIDKVRDWWELIQAVREPTAMDKMIGTNYHYLDIYQTIQEEEHFEPENVIRYPCVTEDGKSLYRYYSDKYLQRLRKRMGEYNFSCQYRLDPVPTSDKVFMEPFPTWEHLPPRKNRIYYMAVDPAATVSRTANHSGIAIGCMDRAMPNSLYLETLVKFKKKPDELATEIVKYIVQYSPDLQVVGIEYGSQTALQPLIDYKISEMKKIVGPFKVPHFEGISTRQSTNSKNDLINFIVGAYLRDGRILLPKVGADAAKREMLRFNPSSDKNEDDLLDAIRMCCQCVPYFSAGQNRSAERNRATWSIRELLERKKQDRAKGAWAAKMVA